MENVNTELLKYAKDKRVVLDLVRELPVLETGEGASG